MVKICNFSMHDWVLNNKKPFKVEYVWSSFMTVTVRVEIQVCYSQAEPPPGDAVADAGLVPPKITCAQITPACTQENGVGYVWEKTSTNFSVLEAQQCFLVLASNPSNSRVLLQGEHMC